MNEPACKAVLEKIKETWGCTGSGMSPSPIQLNQLFREATDTITSLMDEVKTLRASLDDQVHGLVKAAISTDTAYNQGELIYELSVYAESIWSCLLDNDWFEGDCCGSDSRHYFETECDLLKLIKLVEDLSGTHIPITTMKTRPIVMMREWTELTEDVVIACREYQDWLDLNYAPENKEK